eukprot:GHVU01029993.1.p1 GENE.GHVU01029993.1~~GHVU01029993.1.p1  ORF type:complete len:168 (-),score=20.95 GHVU01029993.1:76-579(-)
MTPIVVEESGSRARLRVWRVDINRANWWEGYSEGGRAVPQAPRCGGGGGGRSQFSLNFVGWHSQHGCMCCCLLPPPHACLQTRRRLVLLVPTGTPCCCLHRVHAHIRTYIHTYIQGDEEAAEEEDIISEDDDDFEHEGMFEDMVIDDRKGEKIWQIKCTPVSEGVSE